MHGSRAGVVPSPSIPVKSSIRPAIRVANSRKKHRPGTHRSLKAEFISMEAPFRVVLNWILSPKTEFRARQKACTSMHTLDMLHCKGDTARSKQKGSKIAENG